MFLSRETPGCDCWSYGSRMCRRPLPPPRPLPIVGGRGGVWLLCIFQRLASRGAHTGEDGLTCPGNGQTVAFPALEICVLLSLLTLGTAGQVCGAPCWAAGSAVCCVHARRGPCPPCSVTLGPFPGRLRSCAPGPAVCCELCACVSEWGFSVLCRL